MLILLRSQSGSGGGAEPNGMGQNDLAFTVSALSQVWELSLGFRSLADGLGLDLVVGGEFGDGG